MNVEAASLDLNPSGTQRRDLGEGDNFSIYSLWAITNYIIGFLILDKNEIILIKHLSPMNGVLFVCFYKTVSTYNYTL